MHVCIKQFTKAIHRNIYIAIFPAQNRI